VVAFSAASGAPSSRAIAISSTVWPKDVAASAMASAPASVNAAAASSRPVESSPTSVCNVLSVSSAFATFDVPSKLHHDPGGERDVSNRLRA
jgi:hypothetical protein